MSTCWTNPNFDGHEAVHCFSDEATGLRAIIAIHSTFLGPAGGGTRYWYYADEADALKDALRLSRAMSYKNAMAGLAMGGGKAVILADKTRPKTDAMIASFGRMIGQLHGRYATAQDVGMSLGDMATIAAETNHVCGLPVAEDRAGGDPGPSTALGVFLGVKAAVKQALGRDDVAGLHVAIQGVGSVGGGLARHLAGAGTRLTIGDVDEEKASLLAKELGANLSPASEIHSIESDVFAPCALGGILNERTIAAVRAPIIAGGANNQLETVEDGARLQNRGILFAPDYVINAGGIINVALQYLHQARRADVEAKIAEIPQRLFQVWQEAEKSGETPSAIADRMARRLIGKS